MADHIVATRRSGAEVLVVVSAMGRTTDELEQLAYDVSSTPPARELDMLLTAGERISMALAVHGDHRPGRARGELHRLAGRDPDRHHARPGQDRRGPGRAAPRGARRGQHRDRRRVPGRVDQRGRDHVGPGRVRHDRGRARRRARRRRLRDLHRRRGRLHRRPAHCAQGPAASTGCRTRRCWTSPRPAVGCSRCARSSSPATTTCRSTSARASRGSRGPGSARRTRAMEQAIISGVTHDVTEAKVTIVAGARPAGDRGPAVPHPRRRERQRRHDRAERVERRAAPTSRSRCRATTWPGPGR